MLFICDLFGTGTSRGFLSYPSASISIMAIPERVPIAYEPGYRTGSIGTYEGGQFFGSVTATVEDGAGASAEWYRYKRWYAVLHRFGPDGTHTGSQIWCAGTSENENASIDSAEACLAGWLETLPGRVFGNIAVKLFQVEFEGHTFGLVDQSQEYGGQDHAELVPDDLGFDPPWDGCYDT